MALPFKLGVYNLYVPVALADTSRVLSGGCRLGLCVALLYVVGWVLYQVILHPLAKYPGPFLAKFTNARAGYYAWTGDIHLDMWRCHEKYGPYVRYGPNRLLVNTASGLKDIHGTRTNVTKAKEYLGMVHRMPSTFTLLDKKEHARKRRVLSQGVSDAAVRSFEQSILSHVEKFCSKIASGSDTAEGLGWSVPQNISTWCEYLFFDMITDFVFGRSYNLLDSPEYRYVPAAIKASNKRVSVLVQAPEITFKRMDKKLFPEAILARNQFLKFVKMVVTDKMQAKSGKDVFNILASAKDPETNQGFNMLELGAESISLIVAGSDTTSTLMASLFFYLSHNRGVYDAAVHEVRTCFASASEIRLGTKLNSCKYLRACIDESLRMSPPVGAALFREALVGGATVDGQYIPEGIAVGTGIYSIHHSPLYFPEPFAFRPERWLDRTAPVFEGYAPFSLGNRGCIGKGLALMEAMLTMATVLYTFDFETAPGCESFGGGCIDAPWGRHRENEFQLREHLTADTAGPLLRFRYRKDVGQGLEDGWM